MKTIKIMMAGLIIVLTSITSVAQTTHTKLTEAIYQEETVGDLDKAFEIYRHILSEGELGKPYLAEAAYRIAHIEYLRKNTSAAKSALNSLITQFPKQQKFVLKAQSLLTKISQAAIDLLSAPWGDFETSTYVVLSPAGAKIGNFNYVVRNEVEKGESIWHVDQFLSIPIGLMQEHARATLDFEWSNNLAGAVNSSQVGHINYVYEEGKLVRTQDKENTLNTDSLALSNSVYDERLIPVLLRRLPLTEGYQLNTPVFDAVSGTVLQADIEVVALHEAMTIQERDYPAYELSVAFSRSGKVVRSSKVFVEQGNARKLLRLDLDFGTIEYTGQHNNREKSVAQLGSGENTIEVATPAYWQAFDISAMDPSMEHFQLYIPPMLKASTMLAVRQFPKEKRKNLSTQRIVDGDLNAIKSFFKGYTLRDGSRKDIDVSGLPAQIYVADFTFKDVEMVESRVYILGETRIYWFILRVEKDNYDAWKTTFEEHYKSFKI